MAWHHIAIRLKINIVRSSYFVFGITNYGMCNRIACVVPCAHPSRSISTFGATLLLLLLFHEINIFSCWMANAFVTSLYVTSRRIYAECGTPQPAHVLRFHRKYCESIHCSYLYWVQMNFCRFANAAAHNNNNNWDNRVQMFQVRLQNSLQLAQPVSFISLEMWNSIFHVSQVCAVRHNDKSINSNDKRFCGWWLSLPCSNSGTLIRFRCHSVCWFLHTHWIPLYYYFCWWINIETMALKLFQIYRSQHLFRRWISKNRKYSPNQSHSDEVSKVIHIELSALIFGEGEVIVSSCPCVVASNQCMK